MTLKAEEYHAIYKECPMFCLWAVTKGILFFPKQIISDDEKYGNYDLTSEAYLLMKRLHQAYKDIMLMDSEERHQFFRLEMEFMEEEKKQAESNSKK